MKLSCCACSTVFLLCLLFDALNAQRSRTNPGEVESSPRSAATSRGRSRFAVSTEQVPVEPGIVPAVRKSPQVRRRPESQRASPELLNVKRTYEVEESLDDIPHEPNRRFGKPRVYTESKYEAKNVPPTNTLFQPSTTLSVEDLIKDIGSGIQDVAATAPTLETEPEDSKIENTKLENSSASESPSEIKYDVSKSQEVTTPTTPKIAPARRIPVRSRSNSISAPSSTAEPQIARTRASRVLQAPSGRTRTAIRSRSQEAPRDASTAAPLSPPTRHAVRSSRRRPDASTEPAPKTRGPSVFAASEEPHQLRSRTGRKITRTSAAPEKITIDLEPSSRFSRRGNPSSTTPIPSSSTTTRHAFRSRTRGRSRDVPPVIDEQKLEVLPLFEGETKTVPPPPRRTVKFVAKRRHNSAEDVISPKNDEVKTTVKETVVSEFSEVTSRSVGRKTLPPADKYRRIKVDEPKVSVSQVITRRRKKAGANKVTKLTSSEEDIGESDNYPAAFKALLQAKKESRPAHLAAAVTKTTEKVVTSSIAPAIIKTTSSTTSTTTEAYRQVQDLENELEPSKPTKRHRYTQKTTNAPRRTLPTRTKPTTPVETKFHAKYAGKTESSSPKPRSFSPKPPRGLYSSRKDGAYTKSGKFVSTASTQIPVAVKKSTRYSSRYRNERASSTSAPAYLPTVPSITPPTTSNLQVKSPPEDRDLGLEVITFDDPVNTVPSANLVSGDFAASNPLVSAAQTKDKQVSIIESIINSITSISTTEPPQTTTRLTTTVPVTRGSAILKLTRQDRTTEKPVTTEKPTTVIERILSSLSAIQAENTTTTEQKLSQVGSSRDFNTISSPSTTPMSKSLDAQSTSISPLSVLDDISENQILQKRTIGKLLELLNGLTSPQPVVVVTPKLSYVEPLATQATPTTPLFTSPSPSINSIEPLATSESTLRYTTTPIDTTTQNFITQETTLTTTQPPSTTSAATTLDLTSELGAVLPLFVDSSVTSSFTEPTTTTEADFTYPSTIPSLVNFEVSPGSVSVFSANDLSNTISQDDSLVTISSSTRATTTDSTTTNSPPPSTISSSTLATTDSTTTTNSPSSETTESTTLDSSNALPLGLTITTDLLPSTTDMPTTSPPSSNNTQDNNTTDTTKFSNRSGRLLDVVQDPVQNSIETTTPPEKDYYIFAVLNNNTVLRKRPSKFPNKDTPFLIVGVYPNNTIVRKFPNGTLVPMEPVIRVSGFDTRQNPPALPEITSNQVTPDQGPPADNTTVEQNTIPTVEANPLSVSTSTGSSTSSPSTGTTAAAGTTAAGTTTTTTTSTTPSTTTTSTTTMSTTPITLPTLTEILNGRTVQAFNNIINISDLSNTKRTSVETNQVRDEIRNEDKDNAYYYWKPVTSPTYLFEMLKTTTTLLPTLSNRVLEETNTIPASTVTARATTLPSSTTYRTTTDFPSTTFFPTFLNTILSTLQPRLLKTTTFQPQTTFPTTTLPPATEAPTTTSRGNVRARNFVMDLTSASTTTVRSVDTTPFPSTTRFRVTTSLPDTTTTPATTPPVTTRITTTPVTTRITTTPVTTRITTTPTTTTRTTTTPATTTIRITTTRPPTTTRFTRPTTTTPLPTTTVPTIPSTTTTPVLTTTASTTSRVTRTTAAPASFTSSILPTVQLYTSPRPNLIEGSPRKPKLLTEQQKKDLQTLQDLEKEQQAILKQLAFLTSLNFGSTKQPTTTERSDLANRIIQLAVDRDKNKPTTNAPSTVEDAKKILSQSNPSLDDLVNQLSIVTPSTLSSPYGKSNDAIIAALLKEQGIGPTTPEGLGDIYKHTTTTKKPRPTTRPPGPLMASLNWLLDQLAPPTTKRPKPKAKPKRKSKPASQEQEHELLTNQPTHITPVVTAAPNSVSKSLSQDEIKKLIKQLETIQNDPKGTNTLDLSSIKSLQGLIQGTSGQGGVQVSSFGTRGTTAVSSTTRRSRASRGRSVSTTTAAPVPSSVSNSIEDDEFGDDVVSTTTKPKVSLPPVRLRPVPGVEDEDAGLVRGQLVTAAVNVTRAISQFLGSALQGARSSFRTLVSSGSRAMGNLLQGSSTVPSE